MNSRTESFRLGIAGERGPEILRMGARGGAIMSNAQAFGGGQGNAGGQIEVKVTVDDDGNLQAYVAKASGAAASAVVTQSLTAYDRAKQRQQLTSGA